MPTKALTKKEIALLRGAQLNPKVIGHGRLDAYYDLQVQHAGLVNIHKTIGHAVPHVATVELTPLGRELLREVV